MGTSEMQSLEALTVTVRQCERVFALAESFWVAGLPFYVFGNYGKSGRFLGVYDGPQNYSEIVRRALVKYDLKNLEGFIYSPDGYFVYSVGGRDYVHVADFSSDYKVRSKAL